MRSLGRPMIAFFLVTTIGRCISILFARIVSTIWSSVATSSSVNMSLSGRVFAVDHGFEVDTEFFGNAHGIAGRVSMRVVIDRHVGHDRTVAVVTCCAGNRVTPFP